MVWCMVQLEGVADGILRSSEQNQFSAIMPKRQRISLDKAPSTVSQLS